MLVRGRGREAREGARLTQHPVTGAAIALGIQVHANLPTVSTTVYLVFVIIMVLALFISWLILPANYVVRGDGTLVETQTEVSPMVEMKAWWSFMKDWRLVLLFPMFCKL